jgi:hypothetical protein
VLLIAVGGGETEAIIGSVLIGLSAVAFVSLAFLLIGESEERDRLRHPRG